MSDLPDEALADFTRYFVANYPTDTVIGDPTWHAPRLFRAAERALRMPMTFDLVAHLKRQRNFSEKTFGPGMRTKGLCDHIRKELEEIQAKPLDVSEWVDVIILALDGAWRCGHTPEGIAKAILAKQIKNEGRTWPDWREVGQDKAIEHDRSVDHG